LTDTYLLDPALARPSPRRQKEPAGEARAGEAEAEALP
jgi:hypothetical protein